MISRRERAEDSETLKLCSLLNRELWQYAHQEGQLGVMGKGQSRRLGRAHGYVGTGHRLRAHSEGCMTIFLDRQESEYYAQCVRDFFFRCSYDYLENKEVFELGVGTGETIADLLRVHDFPVKIYGYEINKESYEHALGIVQRKAVSDHYVVTNQDFFEAVKGSVAGGCAISNPPYLPAPDHDIRMPELWGGRSGSEVTKKIIACGFEQLVLLVSSFSDPLGIIQCASEHGYQVLDFAVRTMRFGQYSSEPRVFRRISELKLSGHAFVSSDRYCLAGVAWVKRRGTSDLSSSLKQAITSLASADN